MDTWPKLPRTSYGLVAVLACLVMAGCAGVSSGGQQSNVNSATLSVSPASMAFGTVVVGSSAKQAGTLTAGASDITVSSAAWNGQGYSVSGITFPVTVPAGKSVNYMVTFAPQAPGAAPGSIAFTNDSTSSPLAQNLSGAGGQAGIHTVALNWDPSSSSVVGYNVYRGTQSGGPYQLLTSSPEPTTTYTDSTVLTNTTYFYVATAVDSNHNESVPSNQAQAVVP